MDRKEFRHLLEDKGGDWTKDMLDAELWDPDRREEAHIYLQEQKQEAAAKVREDAKSHRSFYQGGTFWMTVGLLAATAALLAFAWVVLSGPPAF